MSDCIWLCLSASDKNEQGGPGILQIAVNDIKNFKIQLLNF